MLCTKPRGLVSDLNSKMLTFFIPRGRKLSGAPTPGSGTHEDFFNWKFNWKNHDSKRNCSDIQVGVNATIARFYNYVRAYKTPSSSDILSAILFWNRDYFNWIFNWKSLHAFRPLGSERRSTSDPWGWKTVSIFELRSDTKPRGFVHSIYSTSNQLIQIATNCIFTQINSL